MKKILVIEDERDLADLLAFNLEKEGYQTLVAYSGTEGLKLALQELPDLILLDQMLPGMMGTEVCTALRREARSIAIPVLMLTARGEEIDRVVGFEVGVDDYMIKPFSMRELILRVRAILRRCSGDTIDTPVIETGSLKIDSEACRVTVSDKEVELTTTEFKLLLYLAQRPGRVQGRELLLQQVWGYSYLGDTRTVDTHMTRLRGKLGAAGDMIKTVRGFGYKLENQA